MTKSLKEWMTRVTNFLKGDSSWTEAGNGLAYFKKAGVVTVAYYGGSTSFNDTYQTIGTLPTGYRPSKLLYFSAFGVGTVPQVFGYVNTNGVVAARTNSGSITNVGFTVSFPLVGGGTA